MVRRLRDIVLLWTLITAFGLGPGPASAQPTGATVEGTVSGTLEPGSRVTFTVTATHPEGWAALQEIDVLLTLRDAPLDTLMFDADDQAISTGGSRALLGTGNVVTGRFFRIAAVDVSLRTAGKRLTITMRPQVIADVPPGTRFEFVATDDLGHSVSVNRVAPTMPEEGGIPWGTAALALVAALAAGGLVGSRVASHRRPTRSVYATVHRSIEAQPYRRVAPAGASSAPAAPSSAKARPARKGTAKAKSAGAKPASTTRPRSQKPTAAKRKAARSTGSAKPRAASTPRRSRSPKTTGTRSRS